MNLSTSLPSLPYSYINNDVCFHFQVLGVEQVEDEIQIMTKHEFEQFEKKILAKKEKEEKQS